MDFITKFTTRNGETKEEIVKLSLCKLSVDGTSNDYDPGAEAVLITPKERRVCYVLKHEFHATNDEVEYETLIMRLKTTKELRVWVIANIR